MNETQKRLLNRLAFETDHYIDVVLKYHMLIRLTHTVPSCRVASLGDPAL
jgi:hypothetical protein